MIAFINSKVVYILNKKNVSEVIQVINITKENNLNSSVNEYSSFYDFKTNESMLTLRMNVQWINWNYILNHKTQQYEKKSEFINYGSQCLFYDINTCITLFDYKVAKIQNVHHQMIPNSYTDENNPFKSFRKLAMNQDSTKIAGCNGY